VRVFLLFEETHESRSASNEVEIEIEIAKSRNGP